jgi:hypothetical protein
LNTRKDGVSRFPHTTSDSLAFLILTLSYLVYQRHLNTAATQKSRRSRKANKRWIKGGRKISAKRLTRSKYEKNLANQLNHRPTKRNLTCNYKKYDLIKASWLFDQLS